MKLEHSLLPWVRDKYGALRDSSANHSQIVVWDLGISHGGRNPESEANSAFIVRAVNCHDDLVAALWVCAEHNALHFGESHNTVIQARAALEKAKP